MRVLVVDDYDVTLKYLSTVLNRYPGITLQTANSAVAAVAALKSDAYDFVVLDIGLMADVTGIDIAQMIRDGETKTPRNAYLLALTADLSAETKAQCEQVFDLVRHKPIMLNELRDLTNTALKVRGYQPPE